LVNNPSVAKRLPAKIIPNSLKWNSFEGLAYLSLSGLKTTEADPQVAILPGAVPYP
jgi:hypothetical protein